MDIQNLNNGILEEHLFGNAGWVAGLSCSLDFFSSLVAAIQAFEIVGGKGAKQIQ